MKMLWVITILLSVFIGHAYADQNEKIIAEVLGKKITVQNDQSNVNGEIFSSLLDHFAQVNHIVPTEQELRTFTKGLDEFEKEQQIRYEKEQIRLREELKNNSLNPKIRTKKETELEKINEILLSDQKAKYAIKDIDKEQIEAEEKKIAYHFVQRWKINKALHDKYGGRVIFQQFGLEPLEAYRAFLREQEKAGNLKFFDKEHEKQFWSYFEETKHIFLSDHEAAEAFQKPWWKEEKPSQNKSLK